MTEVATSFSQTRAFTVSFDQVADNIAERVEPAQADTDIYVGLEHLDPDSLRLRRWGTPADVEGTKLRFYPGDVIFGRRRAYQRKLAVAEFEGICSAHAMVLRAKLDVCLPAFLPFFLQSDRFFERAMAISVGSLSPTINWKTLAVQKFALPPLDEQRRIAEILWAAEETIQSYSGVLESKTNLTERLIESTLEAGGDGAQSVKLRLGALLLDVQYGTSQRSCPPQPNAIPVLRIPNVFRGEIDLSDLAWVKLTPVEQRKYELESGDVLVVRTNGNPDYVGRCAVVDTLPKGSVFASYLIRLRVRQESIEPAYLSAVFNSAYLRRTLRHEIRSSAGNFNLNAQGIRRQEIPVVSLEKQSELVSRLKVLSEAKATIQQHLTATQKLKAEILRSTLDCLL